MMMENQMSQQNTDTNGSKIAPQPGMFHPTRTFTYVIFGLQIIIAAIAYVILPDVVPIHWDAAGHVNQYGSKLFAVLLIPAISIGIYIITRLVLAAGPRITTREGLRETQDVTE